MRGGPRPLDLQAGETFRPCRFSLSSFVAWVEATHKRGVSGLPKGDDDAIHDADVPGDRHQRRELGAERRGCRGDDQVQRGTDQSRRAALARWAATAGGRRPGQLQRWHADRHRRPLRRGQGGRRRLLADPGILEGGRGRVGLPLPRRRRRLHRGAPRLRDGGLSRGRAGGRPALGRATRADVSDGAEAGRAIEAVWRIESARLIAGLARMTGDVGLAEDLAQDALVAALERWPESGVPENPGAWLMATAKNRAIDLARRGKRFEDRREQLAREAGMRMAMDAAEHEAALGGLGDELLGLIFTCCHPLLSTEARVALTLRLLGGLSTEEIARALLTSESTVAQRIVRAKRTLKEAHASFEVPLGEQLDERLPSVLEVIYLVFNEGYAATAGESWMRLDLCEEALRLGRVLAGLVPKQPEVHGLVA